MKCTDKFLVLDPGCRQIRGLMEPPKLATPVDFVSKILPLRYFMLSNNQLNAY
jgi:hypothetical protein